MAILGKIRKRSGLLLLAIGFALLAFVVQDLFTKGSSSFSKDVGSINGTDISLESFRLKVANAEKNSQGSKQPLTTMGAVNQVWDQDVAVTLLTEQFDNAGIRTSDKSVMDIIQKDPNIAQNPAFQNKLGKFDIAKFREFFKSNPEQGAMLQEREKDADLNAKYQVYSTLIRGGLFTTNAEGKFKYNLESDKANFDYVAVLYSTIKDADIKVSDEDVTNYMKKHEKRFKSDGLREVDYVLIEDKASPKDEAEVKDNLNKLLNGAPNDTLQNFRNTSNVAAFIGENSDKPYDSTYVTKQDLPAQFAEQLYNLPVGAVSEPYVNGKFYGVSKMMAKKAGAKAKASHILISWEGTQVPNKKEKRTKEQALAKAQALLAQAQANPQSFMMLAFQNSDDSSAQQGGDLGYFQPGQMVKPFNDFVFNNPVGKIGLVETQFGYHIINVTDKQDAVRLATLALKLEPSEATSDALYAKATKFEQDAKGNDFAATAKKAGLTVATPAVKAKPMDEVFGTAGNQRQIVKWAYDDDTKVGDVKRFEVVNVGNVIAKLSKISEKGMMSVDEAKPMVEGIIRNQKKAEKIMAKMKGSSLEAIAKANATTVQNAADASVANPMIPNAGAEPKVVGTAFGLGVNKLSAPIEGNAGVYVVKSKAVTKAPKLVKYDDYINKVKGQAAQSAGQIVPALKDNGKIEDNRIKFY